MSDNELTILDQAPGLPQAFGGQEVNNDEMSTGVSGSFGIISYKGKAWKLKLGEEETYVLDAQNQPVPSIEVILVAANPRLSRIYYEGDYIEGSNASPDCYSMDGLVPDPGISNPVSPQCATCPKQEWGSKITDEGKRSKACQDNRRVAVVFPHDLQANGQDANVFLLRVPPASLQALKAYSDKVGKKGYNVFNLQTRIGFELEAAYPKFTFAVTAVISDNTMAENVMALRESEVVQVITAKGVELEQAPPTQAAAPATTNVVTMPAPQETAPAPQVAPIASAPSVPAVPEVAVAPPVPPAPPVQTAPPPPAPAPAQAAPVVPPVPPAQQAPAAPITEQPPIVPPDTVAAPEATVIQPEATPSPSQGTPQQPAAPAAPAAPDDALENLLGSLD